jgi:hypothetical protein
VDAILGDLDAGQKKGPGDRVINPALTTACSGDLTPGGRGPVRDIPCHRRSGSAKIGMTFTILAK